MRIETKAFPEGVERRDGPEPDPTDSHLVVGICLDSRWGPEIPGKSEPTVKGVCLSAHFGPLVRLSKLIPPASSLSSSQSKPPAAHCPTSTHLSFSLLPQPCPSLTFSPFSEKCFQLGTSCFLQPLAKLLSVSLCLCPMEQETLWNRITIGCRYASRYAGVPAGMPAGMQVCRYAPAPLSCLAPGSCPRGPTLWEK